MAVANFIPGFGEILSLLTGLMWAIAVIFFRKSGYGVPPLVLNLFKNVVALFLLFATMFILRGEAVPNWSPLDWLLVAGSGAVGIGLADTLYFMALNTIGAGFLAIVDCLYSPLVILFAFFFLGERLSLMAGIGATMIVLAVLMTSQDSRGVVLGRKQVFSGILYGVVSMALMAVGIVVIKPILNESSLLWVIVVRLVGGIAAILVIGSLLPLRRQLVTCFGLQSLRRYGAYTIPSALIGGYLALVVWVGGMKFTQVNIASILNQLSTIFILILAAFFLGERFTVRKLLAVILAMAGAAIVVIG